MSIDERIVRDLITHRIDLMRYEASYREEVLAKLDKMRRKVEQRLRARDLSALNRRELAALLRDIEYLLNRDYGAITDDWEDEQEMLLEEEHHHYLAWAAALAVLYGLSKPKGLSDRQLADLSGGLLIAGHSLPDSLAKQKSDLMHRLTGLIRLEWANALTGGEWVFPDIRAVFKRQADYTAMLVSAWVHRAAGEVLFQCERVNPWVMGWRHLSILDSRTSSVCTARHGLCWDKALEPIGHDYPFAKPPLHINCRSMLAPFAEGGEESDFTGDDWVKSRTLSELQEQFGKGIGQMLFDGEITLADAVKGGGLKPVTLGELEAKRTDFDRVKSWVRQALHQPQSKLSHVIGNVTAKNAQAVKDASGLDIARFTRRVHDDELRHIFGSHGDRAKERARGQRAIVPSDFQILNHLVENADSVKEGDLWRRVTKTIEYRKKYGKETWVYVEAYGKKKKHVQFVSLRIHEKK